MHTTLKKLLDREIATGRLAVAANLLYEAALVGWIAFGGLYALEALLPTFVTARLSLVKFGVLLLVLSSILIWLSQHLKPVSHQTKKETSRPLSIFLIITGLGIVTLTHYRFPWWSIPISISSYGLIVWLFFRLFQKER